MQTLKKCSPTISNAEGQKLRRRNYKEKETII